MQKVLCNNIEVSKLVLGGGKMVDMDLVKGKALVNKALQLGINTVDGHHRYGNCEDIIGQFDNIVKMTKISSYQYLSRDSLIDASYRKMNWVDILWVSDLDDITLYSLGEQIYNELKNDYLPNIGITTENAQLAELFMEKYPECTLFMVPLYIGRWDMARFVKKAQSRGKRVFTIKTFCDKLLLDKYSIRDCLNFVKDVNPDVTVLGTSNGIHLEELVTIYESI